MEPEAYDIMEDLAETYWWYRARREIIESLIGQTVGSKAKILDFGAGSGYMSRYLAERGYEVVAADIDPIALKQLQEKGIPTTDPLASDNPKARYDCILLGDVLEHVENDAQLISQLDGSLNKGGVFVATAPAFDFLWSGEDFVSRHVRRYTRSTFGKVFKRDGYDILKLTYFNFLLFPAVVAILLLTRIFMPRRMYVSDVKPLSSKLNRLLYRIFRIEKFLLRRCNLPFGASVLIIARKT